MPADIRLEQLTQWIHQTKPNAQLAPASADASFRRYFRVTEGQQTWVAMDAPQDKDTLLPFIDIGKRLCAESVNAPKIYQADLNQGFLLMDDLGTTQYLDKLNGETADSLYGDALRALIKIQAANLNDLPKFDEKFVGDELAIMPEWFLSQYLGIELIDSETESLQAIFSFLIKASIEQPQVFMHRDYHSRNLMVTSNNNPGVIDYQGAVIGPICYDLASLLRDCYIVWPEHKINSWVEGYRVMAVEAGLLTNEVKQGQFKRWFDLIGLQRHIKVLGIFARLSHRDGKPAYLADLPLTLSYVLSVSQRYEETAPLIGLFDKYDIPRRIGMIEIAA